MASCNNISSISSANCLNDNRVCIQTTRVFDACIKHISLENQSVSIIYITPPTLPVTFISAESYGTLALTNLSVTQIPNSCCQRVQCTANIPIEFSGVSDSEVVCAKGCIAQKLDLLMKIPAEALIPATIQCTGIVEGISGTLDLNNFVGNLCMTLITKVVAAVELIIHSEGYPILTASQDYTEDACSRQAALPLYPKKNNSNARAAQESEHVGKCMNKIK